MLDQWKSEERNSVLFPDGSRQFVGVNKSECNALIELAQQGKARFCTHADTDSYLHEMIIFHRADTVVAPHRPVRGPESYLVLKGRICLVFYSDDGDFIAREELEEFHMSGNFFLRIEKATFRGVVVLEDSVFVEVKTGPLENNPVQWADWGSESELKATVVRDSR